MYGTMVEEMLSGRSDVLWLNGDDADTQMLFQGITSTRLRTLLYAYHIVVIDEAQHISEIGLRLKLITVCRLPSGQFQPQPAQRIEAEP